MKSGEKPTAVITGASTGIGFELAKQFAQNGHDIVIVSNSDRIKDAAQELRAIGKNVFEYKHDLSRKGEIEKFYDEVRTLGKDIGIIALNAGVGLGGPFRENDIDEEVNMINLNVVSTVYLTKLFLNGFLENNGKILFTSSIVSDMPAPYSAIYGATKAFVQSFANALREELKETNISITTLMPGATNTNFFARAGLLDTKVGAEGKFENEPSEVAKQGYEALMNGVDEVYAASAKTKLEGVINKFLPEKVKAILHKKQAEPGSAYH
ncbi:SDR family NAD(P)-dependent oxidoreductase [Peredibacter starrii]|uniref:SDR family NAD(P)-dependent oxidoreductase n=1 Tax=Peredibacter starrii TaxID=28202 RepID=A0AAX4HVK0_9BACT|nr:SDR family NAD(P)-dependent oxidoreductase [Peredibacter starrii]WPU67197.1 SDR family NAD(P)-dependent oxidoreductase [Peredibacter starrii]